MRIYPFIYLFWISLFGHQMILSAQDDVPDYRSKREGFLKLTDKKLRAELATFTIGGISESLIAEKLPEVPIQSIADSQIIFQLDSFYLNIQIERFSSIGHKLLFYDEKYLVKIDNKAFWGSGTKMPTTCIKKITLLHGVDTIPIPEAAYIDLYEPQLYYKENGILKSYCKVIKSKDSNSFYIYMLNGHDKNRYEVTWIIQNKQYLRRVIDVGF